MSDLIERQKALDALKGKLNASVKDTEAVVEYLNGVIERILQIPSAEPERKIYAKMSDEEFEKWLYEHGICHTDIHETISCKAVQLLIDYAINELPSAEPEIIRCKDCEHRYIEEKVWNCPFGLSGGEKFFCGYGARTEGENDE